MGNCVLEHEKRMNLIYGISLRPSLYLRLGVLGKPAGESKYMA